VDLQAIDHVAMAVQDVERSAQWYVDVMGFARQHDDVWNGYPVFVGNENAAVALFPIRSDDGRKSPGAVRILHFAFRTSGSGFAAAQKELKARNIVFEFQDHQVSHSIYFHDPDGHEIEITTYQLM
jgi:catechol 2,3-dioxygenase-like lactoylglutathione lyase family enzyme